MNVTTVTPAVALVGVSRVFPGDSPVVALDAVDLTIRTGELVAVVGPSGSGKSTLLAILGLLDRPTAGSYWQDGVDVSTLDDDTRSDRRASHLGFVFQSFHLLSNRSALENVALAAMYAGVPRHARLPLAAEALAGIGLAHRRNFLPTQLSGGEQQRVAIARAMVKTPSLLLCDEPTGNLDSRNRDAVLDALVTVNGTGTTVCVITHDEVVASAAGRRVAISDGRVHDSAA